ncbi:hypothetical protein ACOZ4B_20910 (plasmid) [Haloferax prahovense]|uniref:hypothetical protein n=1 Tax=Haloferax prahovense TaxID=381852 RepID=UPI003C730556
MTDNIGKYEDPVCGLYDDVDIPTVFAAQLLLMTRVSIPNQIFSVLFPLVER